MDPGKHILVVEDSLATRAAMKAVLEAKGYRVDCAENGRAALHHLREKEERPSVILLDLNMPVMDGRQFRHRQLQDPALAPISVVIISSETNLPEIAASLEVAGYITKPVEFEAVLQTIQRLGNPQS